MTHTSRGADWLCKGAIVYDRRLEQLGRVMDVGYPPGEDEQVRRAWVRPLGGGREWNPLVEDLLPREPGGVR